LAAEEDEAGCLRLPFNPGAGFFCLRGACLAVLWAGQVRGGSCAAAKNAWRAGKPHPGPFLAFFGPEVASLATRAAGPVARKLSEEGRRVSQGSWQGVRPGGAQGNGRCAPPAALRGVLMCPGPAKASGPRGAPPRPVRSYPGVRPAGYTPAPPSSKKRRAKPGPNGRGAPKPAPDPLFGTPKKNPTVPNYDPAQILTGTG
jgi:hypothetical protein